MSTTTPSTTAASIKVIADAIKTTFGATVVAEAFVGLALIAISSGLGNLLPEQRERVIYVFLGFMGLFLGVMFVLRICKPEGLSGPPIPSTEDTKFVDSTVDES